MLDSSTAKARTQHPAEAHVWVRSAQLGQHVNAADALRRASRGGARLSTQGVSDEQKAGKHGQAHALALASHTLRSVSSTRTPAPASPSSHMRSRWWNGVCCGLNTC